MAANGAEYEAYEEDVEFDGDAPAAKGAAAKKGTYVGIHNATFKDFVLKPEIRRAITDVGFEHPSEVQCDCIPRAILGTDVLCQARSGMGKTAVFVLSTLQQMTPVEGEVQVLVICHTRELAYQVCYDYERLARHLPDVKVKVFFGGVPIKQHIQILENDCPNIVVGTPGRMLQLIKEGHLKVGKVKHFIIDECDKVLEMLDMRRQVQEIFKATPHDKQVMMFTATLSEAIKPVCRKFMQNPMEVLVENESKLTLHGLVQHYVELEERQKNRKLTDLLDALNFNQVVVFVKSPARAEALNTLLTENNFPSIFIHGRMEQEERIKRFRMFKQTESRILITTDLFGRGIDIQSVNIVINYDMPTGEHGADSYLHRVGRAGRFGTKGLAISFVASAEDTETLNAIQSRFEVSITPLPDQINSATYMNA